MGRIGDGLSREDRIRNIMSRKQFAVIDNSMESLISQTVEIARFVRFYSLQTKEKEYFDELLPLLKDTDKLKRITDLSDSSENGDMEPSQALLYTFLSQLREVTEEFNQRWCGYASWYIEDILKIKPLSPEIDQIWLSFRKNCPENIIIEKNTAFVSARNINDHPVYYRTIEDLEVQGVEVTRAYSLYFEKQKNIDPASMLDCVTSLKIKDLINDPSRRELMFGKDRGLQYSRSLGFIITSPSLLLREGKRSVKIRLFAENTGWTKFVDDVIKDKRSTLFNVSKENAIIRLLNNIFYLNISTVEGWERIENYSIKMENNSLIVKFILAEDFPATSRCNMEIHGLDAVYPSLKVHLNLDAWLYPYSWTRKFILKNIIITTHVEGINNMLVYNELGKVDNSRPFLPFGINTERGAWFAVGNYEMALKNISWVDINIHWGQLPDCKHGLQEYYSGYRKNLHNGSFRLQAKYLVDYNWKDTANPESFYLFSTDTTRSDGSPFPDHPLSMETQLTRIRPNKMDKINIGEDKYDYNILTKSGFLSFVLERPDIGFGEKYYRQLFSDLMIKNILKKKGQPALNTPITPLINRIILNYEAEDVIDLRSQNSQSQSAFYHLYPLGNKQVYPDLENTAVPLTFSLPEDANLLLALENVKGGELLTLYLDFLPASFESASQEIPLVKWYWGDGYYWKEMIPGSIMEDSTQNLRISGHLKINIPVIIEKRLFDKSGILWLRAGICANEDSIPELNGIYTNVVCTKLDDSELKNLDDTYWEEFFKERTELVSEINLPGISEVKQITPYHDGLKKESSLEMQIRTSEYVSHRGKAVIPRDYERMALQAFPNLDKAKCLPCLDLKSGRKGVVTLVVIPKFKPGVISDGRPMLTSRQMLDIEEYFVGRVSPAVTFVDVINPVYEELTVRCNIDFEPGFSFGLCTSRLKMILDDLVAPWRKKQKSPQFGCPIDINDIYKRIKEENFVHEVKNLSVIQVAETGTEKYEIYEYGKGKSMIEPSKPYAILIPAAEHLIASTTSGDVTENFGVNDMIINKTFIVRQDGP